MLAKRWRKDIKTIVTNFLLRRRYKAFYLTCVKIRCMEVSYGAFLLELIIFVIDSGNNVSTSDLQVSPVTYIAKRRYSLLSCYSCIQESQVLYYNLCWKRTEMTIIYKC